MPGLVEKAWCDHGDSSGGPQAAGPMWTGDAARVVTSKVSIDKFMKDSTAP